MDAFQKITFNVTKWLSNDILILNIEPVKLTWEHLYLMSWCCLHIRNHKDIMAPVLHHPKLPSSMIPLWNDIILSVEYHCPPKNWYIDTSAPTHSSLHCLKWQTSQTTLFTLPCVPGNSYPIEWSLRELFSLAFSMGFLRRVVWRQIKIGNEPLALSLETRGHHTIPEVRVEVRACCCAHLQVSGLHHGVLYDGQKGTAEWIFESLFKSLLTWLLVSVPLQWWWSPRAQRPPGTQNITFIKLVQLRRCQRKSWSFPEKLNWEKFMRGFGLVEGLLRRV